MNEGKNHALKIIKDIFVGDYRTNGSADIHQYGSNPIDDFIR